MKRFIHDESGQAMTEWLIVAGVFVLALVGVMGTFPGIMGDYYSRLAAFLMLPSP